MPGPKPKPKPVRKLRIPPHEPGRIPPGASANFDTIVRAAKREDLCLLSTTHIATNTPAYLLCAVNHIKGPRGSTEFVFVPLAQLIDGNPYDQFTPPQS